MTAKKAQVISDKTALQDYFKEAKNLLDTQLQSLNPIIGKLKLHRQIEYTLQTQGKHLRSTMVLLSGESLGANRQNLQNLALAVELLHSASLVHDDILDQDVFRRNALSVQAKWSVKEAILVGDALASLALSLCRSYPREILDLMAQTCLQLSDGEYMDVQPTEEAFCEKHYLEKVRKKTASLFQAAAECGALAANGSPQAVEALACFGENYGLAFQIRDDMEDAGLEENDLSADLREFRVALPVVHFYGNSNQTTQIQLQKLALTKKKNSLDREFLRELQVAVKDGGSLVYCAEKICGYVDLAVASLSPIKESSSKELLIQMAQSLKPT